MYEDKNAQEEFSDSRNGTGGGPAQNSGDSTQKYHRSEAKRTAYAGRPPAGPHGGAWLVG